MKPADFARLFDAQHRGFTDDLRFWLGLADRLGDPILELGCGAGRVLIPLAEAGHRVIGVDSNPYMLQRLTGRVQPAFEAEVTTVLGELTDLRLNESYPLLLAPCNTLASLSDPALEQLLIELRAHLTTDGALAFEAPPPSAAGLPVEPGEIIDSFHEPEHNVDVQVSATQSFDPIRGVATVQWRYDEMLQSGEVQRFERTTEYSLRSPSDFERVLSTAGFEHTQFFGDYEQGPFGEESEILLVLAHAEP
ncbi:MAG: class I SAM-dependent methyltransferase [Anaerolineales bacterium]